MPRTARQVFEGVPHHIVLRGNNRRRLFSYPRDYLLFIRLICADVERSNVSAHALCLMPNHVHLLATPFKSDSFERFVKRVAQRYAQVRNRRYGTTGKLFEQRYYSKPMKSEAQLAIVTAYIDLNPVRAHLVEDGNDYAWSTHRIHSGLSCLTPGLKKLWSPTDWYLRLGPEPAEREAVYRDWISECRDRDNWDEIRKDPPSPKGGAPTRPNRSRAAG
ncbi:MAG: transposase [Polyangiales bacterium]